MKRSREEIGNLIGDIIVKVIAIVGYTILGLNFLGMIFMIGYTIWLHIFK